MSEFTQPQHSHHDDGAPETPDVDMPAVTTQSQGLDSVLDMIDDVLAVDAQEFVRGFVQKGGE
ncbi:ubiquitin-like protein Pup [Actinomyces vulturis]|uniref:ubiquitin-like protein Pup n=1 Tax=Actinomyces vulturis TaxID=1857645 RepID=UPI0008319D76|nr:ubiquitin-like protein Pup [Actinomyces vulturis]